MSFRLIRLPSGAWGLVVVPDAQRLKATRDAASFVRENLAERPAVIRRRPVAAEVSA